MQENSSTDTVSRRAMYMGAAGVSLILCTAVSIIAIINDKMALAGSFAVLAVCSHLFLWRQLHLSHKENEAADNQAD